MSRIHQFVVRVSAESRTTGPDKNFTFLKVVAVGG